MTAEAAAKKNEKKRGARTVEREREREGGIKGRRARNSPKGRKKQRKKVKAVTQKLWKCKLRAHRHAFENYKSLYKGYAGFDTTLDRSTISLDPEEPVRRSLYNSKRGTITWDTNGRFDSKPVAERGADIRDLSLP